MSSINRLKLIDIGANLLDEMYSGSYNSKPYHGADLDAVLERSWASGELRFAVHTTMHALLCSV